METSDEKSIYFVPKEILEMFDQMQLPKHREATEELFRATAEELNATYRDVFADNKTQSDKQS